MLDGKLQKGRAVSSKEIFALRKQGRIAEALEMARAEYQKDTDDIWFLRAYAWPLYDHVKQLVDAYEAKRLSPTALNERMTPYMREFARMGNPLRGDSAFSQMIRLAGKASKDWNDFLAFAKWAGINDFAEEDKANLFVKNILEIFFFASISVDAKLKFRFSFLFDDFMRFVVHWCMHRVPFLWHFHSLHHTATTLTPFTVHRTHPLESFINSSRAMLSLGIVSGVFVWLFGHGLQVWDILGVNALGFVMTLAGSNLRHSHIPLHFGVAESLLISPAQHQLHHSVDHEHPNLGSFLSCWDRLCGSWMAGREAKDLRFGLSTSGLETLDNGYCKEAPRASPI